MAAGRYAPKMTLGSLLEATLALSLLDCANLLRRPQLEAASGSFCAAVVRLDPCDATTAKRRNRNAAAAQRQMPRLHRHAGPVASTAYMWLCVTDIARPGSRA
jgi:hypothetical protein